MMMKLTPLILLLAVQAPAAEAPATDALPAELGLAAGVEQMKTEAAAGEFDRALAIADQLVEADSFTHWRGELEQELPGLMPRLFGAVEPMLESLGLGGPGEVARAHLQHARGVVLLQKGEVQEAAEAFLAARAMAGPGGLRGDATYNIGWMQLVSGESWRAQIPELGGQAPQPAPGAQDEDPPDPLEEARKAYRAARKTFIEGLQIERPHADTQANLELVIRRLRELDEIEREREQQQDDQQDPENSEDSEQQQDPSEGQAGEDQQDESQQPGQEGESEDSKSEAEREAEARDRELQERELTDEEAKRLDNQLEQHEQEGERVRKLLLEARRIPMKRDW